MASELYLFVPLALLFLGVLALYFINHDRTRGELARVRRTEPEFNGVLTTPAFTRDLARELNRASRHEFPVALSLLSVEGARAAGVRGDSDDADDLMRQTARTWSRNLRADSALARHDVAVFAALLPHAGRDGGMAAAARLRTAAPRDVHPVIGAVVEYDGTESPQALLTRADAELRRVRRRTGYGTPAAA